MNEEGMKVKTVRTLQEAIDEVERELNVRSRCFPRWIPDGRVSRTDAQDRLDRLATAYQALSNLVATSEVEVKYQVKKSEPSSLTN